ncbi:response regulator [Leptothoe kymatousa]|uniref:histidine kinase n=1 Tax=Leptothoe kymatousa TAU-MAC 1615 TaxID=2364775 RepID=A0ABS5Y646_9CYAN|nr:response regulator [Leptothoe kymatousa]MBT9313277.1 response regulator [Leptothoe kymatousa TAU-MAC 1615]
MVSHNPNRRSSAFKPKVLVVDDEPNNLDLLYRTFYKEFRLLRAESAQEALVELAKNPDTAVIISDQRMPSMSGTDLLKKVAEEYPNTVRIILTGYTDVEDLVDAINAGQVFKYLTKPWEEEELRDVVHQAVSTHTVLKSRTRDFKRILEQETLLKEITHTIRSTETSEEMQQVIARSLGTAFKADYCVLRSLAPNQLRSCWLYQGEDVSPMADDILAATAIDTDELQILTAEDSTPRSEYLQLAAQSSLIIPLISKREPLAILAIHHCKVSKHWEDDELKLIKTVVDQAALALAQTWTYERVQALAQREVLINTITQAIHSSLEPKQIFAAITEKLGQALEADGCAISLWTQGDDYVDCVGLYDAYQTQTPKITQSQVKIGENPILQDLLASRSPVVFDDLSKETRYTPPHISLHFQATALLVVPLIADSQIIGSISLRQNKEPRHWHMEEINLAQAVANQAAIAVQQARLYQTTRKQAEQLLALDKQKTTFFQNISHEFRTPLTLTIGPLEAAVEQGSGLPLDQSVIALRNSQRLLRLVNQLLDLQRLDADSMQAMFYPCDFAQVVSNIAESFQAYCDRKHITLSTQIQPCPAIYLDLEKFDKVVYNILSNAVKFTPAGGSIQINLNTFENRCYLEIEDTGIGIRKEQLPHIFERFQQADGSASRTHEGTGLGLALVKELVELHGGDVRVSSTYGAGTIFTIELPLGADHLPADRISHESRTLEQRRAAVELADLNNEVAGEGNTPAPQAPEDNVVELSPAADAPACPVPKIATIDGGGANILVVDDNRDLRSYVASILQRQGHRISTAHNGAAGLEVARNIKPQLIITDLMMPQVSGLELIQQVRQDPELQGTPIILLTAKVGDETRLEGVEQGADAYISKPFKDREVLAEVRNLLALKANEQKVTELNQYLTDSVLKRFLPASLVKKAAHGELQLNLKPEPRLITVLFSDIVGFTQLSNTLRSRRVAELLNEYFEAMTQAIFESGGTVDKFMGDAVLALFGAPETLSPNEQVRRAIAAARRMYKALAELNERWTEQGVPSVNFRCGIHQGTAVVGMFGSADRTDYTAIGPSVNIAARLQEAADGESILVSAAVADYLDENEIVKFSPLQLKGIDETVLTFNVKTTLPEETIGPQHATSLRS